MHQLPILQPGDTVELVAPASRCADTLLQQIINLLDSWQLQVHCSKDLFGEDLLCANSDERRFNSLKKALLNPNSKAVICVRGGYGSMRLIPDLMQLTAPVQPKIFLGMSDITALNLFLQQYWHWPVIHGGLALDKFSSASILAIKSLLFGEVNQISYSALPLNDAARQSQLMTSRITGGNLSLVQTSIGTHWQLDGRQKIILLEEVSERGYRIDRMLVHLQQANIFDEASAIVLGDFTGGQEPDGSSLVWPVLERFAANCSLPVVRVSGIGHDTTSLPVPLGAEAQLQLGQQGMLNIISRV